MSLSSRPGSLTVGIRHYVLLARRAARAGDLTASHAHLARAIAYSRAYRLHSFAPILSAQSVSAA